MVFVESAGIEKNMLERELKIEYKSYGTVEELSPEDQILCKKAKDALQSSYSPYSNFKVATAVLLRDGTVVTGSNQENLAYPSGLCAERVALFAIGAQYPGAVIEKMVITAHTDKFKITQPVTCCGGCLQVMSEVEQRQRIPIEVIFYCLDGELLKVQGVRSLLPFSFAEDRLQNG